MLNILLGLLVFLVGYVVLGVAMAFIWTYCFSDKYWAWRERLAERKEKKRLNKKGL